MSADLLDPISLSRRIINGGDLARDEARDLFALRGEAVYDLFYAAHKVRRHFHGNRVTFCSILPTKFGNCGEDCKFCAQSGHFDTGIEAHTMMDGAEVADACTDARNRGASAFGIVNSGRGPTKREWPKIMEAVHAMKEVDGICHCATLGTLNEEQARDLKNAGVRRINHNLETSREFYPQIVTTHSWQERVDTVRLAQRVGLETCCGSIFGMGETIEDRVSLAFSLKELNPNVVPLNFLFPIPGTPLENTPRLKPMEILKIVAVMRLILPHQDLKVAGGREKNLRDLQSWIFYVGATSGLIGNYLATSGRANEEDLQMIEDLELTWNDDRVGDADPVAAAGAAADAVAAGVAGAVVTLEWMDDDLNDRRRRGLYRVRRGLHSAQGPHVRWQGRDFVNFSSNDYLNLAADPRLARSVARAARRYGCGAGASALVSGRLPPLRALERDLARWEGTEAALVFSSGYAANLAVVGTLPQADDAIFSDALNHASLIDGCRLSRAGVYVYRHADLNHLAELLKGRAARRRYIVSDSVFSMDGDAAPLARLLELAERFDCVVLLDEAHATGLLGEYGRGLTDLLPPGAYPSERIVKVGTLSKALGSQGGFVCGSRRLIAWLIHHARPYIFSTALAPPVAAAGRCAVALVRKEPERRRHVLALGERLRIGLRGLGKLVGASCCQIVPVIVGDAHAAVALSNRLEEQGLLAPAIRPPSVPEGTARLRISLSAGHTTEDVDRLIGALR